MLSSARWCLHYPFVRCVRLASSAVYTPRRGRNLTERYRRLENIARARSGRPTHVSLTSQGSATADKKSYRPGPTATPTAAGTIAGFLIPQEPHAPADDECCMSGCAICVYDLYEEAFAAYKDSVRTLRAALSARRIPETEWPAHIRTARTSPTATTTEKTKGAVLDAFEEMERVLKERRDKRAAVEAEKRARGDVLVGDGEKAVLDLHSVYEGIKWIMFPNR